jgi:hypothetical protein
MNHAVNWEAISAIGQIVGALAVVISLLYLAREVRSSAQATRVASMHSLSDKFNRWSQQLAGQPHLSELYYRGGQSAGPISAELVLLPLAERPADVRKQLEHGLSNVTAKPVTSGLGVPNSWTLLQFNFPPRTAADQRGRDNSSGGRSKRAV